jgi:hypothetical protein
MVDHPRGACVQPLDVADLGFGRIVVSEVEGPNILVNLV